MSRHLIRPLLNHSYPVAKSASGIWITDVSGRKYFDGSSGAITCSLGHSHPRILETIARESKDLQFVYRSQFSSTQAEALAEKLCTWSRDDIYEYTFFVNSGTEAMETAMKVAWQYWQESGLPEKRQFITRRKSYHGITMGALSLSGHSLRRRRFEDLLEPYPALTSDLMKDSAEHQAQELQHTIDRLGASSVAAFVSEPVVGAAGAAIHPPKDYYQKIKQVCQQNNILFIADEVMTGLGRTGTKFGLDHWNTTADIIAVGKSLGAGYAPIAATLMTKKVLEPIKNGSGLIMSGHTYSAHPLSCAIALDVLKTIEEDNLLSNVQERGIQLIEGLSILRQKFPVIDATRGVGLMTGFEFDSALPGLQQKFIGKCFENGLLVYPSVSGPEGKDENGILIAPPFITTSVEMEILLDRLEKSLNEFIT
ncbi:MAG: aspartate aminotransferase family protein [Cyclobacteriaceae bacterium]